MDTVQRDHIFIADNHGIRDDTIIFRKVDIYPIVKRPAGFPFQVRSKGRAELPDAGGPAEGEPASCHAASVSAPSDPLYLK